MGMHPNDDASAKTLGNPSDSEGRIIKCDSAYIVLSLNRSNIPWKTIELLSDDPYLLIIFSSTISPTQCNLSIQVILFKLSKAFNNTGRPFDFSNLPTKQKVSLPLKFFLEPNSLLTLISFSVKHGL